MDTLPDTSPNSSIDLRIMRTAFASRPPCIKHTCAFSSQAVFREATGDPQQSPAKLGLLTDRVSLGPREPMFTLAIVPLTVLVGANRDTKNGDQA